MTSKMVLARSRSAAKVAQAADTHGDAVASILNPLFAATGVPADVAPAIKGLGALVRKAAEEMVRADVAHEEELADDAAPRTARDEAVQRLYAPLTEVRAAASVAYGDATVALLGFSGPTPKEPTAILALGRAVLAALPKLRDAKPRSRGLSIDPEVYLAELPGTIAALAAALEDVTREAREAETTLTAKHRAIATYDERFSAAAAALTALFQLAGEHELAARVRPSVSRPGQTEVDEEPVAPPVG